MQDIHLRNLHLQDIIRENEELRSRLAPFSELQQCADELLFQLEAAKRK